MTFKASLWQAKFKALPTWPCPSCETGTVVAIKDAEFVKETGPSEEAHSLDEWEPEWMTERFSAPLKCSSCGEIAIVTGSTSHRTNYSYDYEGRTEMTAERTFEPETFHPPPSVISLPEKTPESVADEINRASALIWLDIGSSANRLRTATEELLTALGIARHTISKRNKRVRLHLEARITRLAATKPEAAKLLQSIRVIGNVGTHDSLEAIDRADLLSAFEIMEHVLEKLFDNREQRLAKAAKDISKRNGKPAKRKPKRKTK